MDNESIPDILTKPLHPKVVEHITILEEYFKVQRELFETLKEQPTTEFEQNTYNVKVMELNNEIDTLSSKLSHSINQLTYIRE